MIKLSYEDILYRFLTEFHDYPQELRDETRAMTVLLVDVYDLVVKFESDYNQQLGSHNYSEITHVQAIENEQKDAFYEYLMQSEKASEQQLYAAMQKKGLVFK